VLAVTLTISKRVRLKAPYGSRRTLKKKAANRRYESTATGCIDLRCTLHVLPVRWFRQTQSAAEVADRNTGLDFGKIGCGMVGAGVEERRLVLY
jgi:hypothetical protein